MVAKFLLSFITQCVFFDAMNAMVNTLWPQRFYLFS